MYHNFPFVKVDGEISLIRYVEQKGSSSEDTDFFKDLLKAFQLINAARTLHVPTTDKCIDEDLDYILRDKISKLLKSAALKTAHENVKQVLSNRAVAFINQTYSESALFASCHSNLSVEILIGLLPSWRYKKKAKTYSGLLALPYLADADLINIVDINSPSLIRKICDNIGVPVIRPSADLPVQITCDIIALAGDFAAHPLHIAHFLPEDEGNYEGKTLKTLIYRNLYLSRFKEITIPLAEHFFHISDSSLFNNEELIWQILVTWFRGHDIGHVHFDQLCISLPGVNKRKRYALQEAFADLFGYLLTLKLIKSSLINIPEDFLARTYIHEMLRYMTRDVAMFPDAKSAWMQFGYLLNEKVIIKQHNGKLDINYDLVSEKLNDLMGAILKMVINKDTAYVESLLDSFAGFDDNDFSMQMKKVSIRKEADPIFSFADSQLKEDQALTSVNTLRDSLSMYEYDGRKRF